MNEFLTSQYFLYERIQQGKEIYPADGVLKQFQQEAKKIDAQRHFTIYGCQDCIQSLVKFVYENQTKEDGIKKTKRQAGDVL